MTTFRAKSLLCSGIPLAVIAASGGTAMAADITVKSAAIQGGKLMISGKTASPNTWVRLDSRKAADFNVKSGADGAFSFGVVYHPGDCIVEVQKLVSPTQLGAATEALVGNCGPVGITPRGPWSAKAPYAANDLVTHDGSSWRAKRDNSGKQPGAAADWELFAAKGDTAEGESQAAAEGNGASQDVADAKAAKRDTPTGPAGGDLTGTYPTPSIKPGAVTTAKLASFAVTAPKLAPNAVTTAKLAANSVKTLKIAVGAITNERLAANAVTTSKVLDEGLTAADLAPNSVSAAEIADNSISRDELAADSVTASEIEGNAVGAAEIAADAVGSSEIAAGAVSSSEIGSVHEHTGPATNVTDGTLHDGSYASSTATVACGIGEKLLSVSVDWTNRGGHNEVFFAGADAINRGVNPQTATLRVGYDGGATQATWVPVATCL